MPYCKNLRKILRLFISQFQISPKTNDRVHSECTFLFCSNATVATWPLIPKKSGKHLFWCAFSANCFWCSWKTHTILFFQYLLYLIDSCHNNVVLISRYITWPSCFTNSHIASMFFSKTTDFEDLHIVVLLIHLERLFHFYCKQHKSCSDDKILETDVQ